MMVSADVRLSLTLIVHSALLHGRRMLCEADCIRLGIGHWLMLNLYCGHESSAWTDASPV